MTSVIAQPRTVEREVVIDDFIRNFLVKGKMTKTMNVFQQEWYELQKKGTFQDLGIGLIADIKNKNAKMESKIAKMTDELKQAKIVAENAKSTWEKLRKERDFHKLHQDRVNGEKVMITGDIKNVKTHHEDLQERIEEMKKKHLATVKEKALLKLEKDKLQRKVHDIDEQIKDRE
jgi:chromosome segregation ATPase